MGVEDSKLIVKNTALLYFRMLLTMAVSLYTSRIILSTLGIEDFGIYNVVGGVIAMFTFMSASMSTATSRFLTYELGLNDSKKLKIVFNSALTIHIGLAFLILVFAETIGLWFLEYKLVIPESRMFAARIIYQFSIVSCMIAVIQIPYNATIIAHERMNIFAYVSIMEVSLKLLVVFILTIGNLDKLILYAELILFVTVTVTIIYKFYCNKNFIESRYSFEIDKEVLISMATYSGWDLYGNLSVMVRTQGVNMLQNIFFGPIINAASGIASQVQVAISGFADNFLTAVRPQIVKSYAKNDLEYMQKLIYNSSKYSFLLLLLLSLPLIVENKFVLDLWLKNVPEYAVVFCQLSLINNLISILFRTIMFSIHATGKIKRMSFINGTIYISVLPISYILLKNGHSPVTPFVVNIILLIFACISNVNQLRIQVPRFSMSGFFKNVIFVCILVASVSSVLPMFIYFNMSDGWLRFILVGLSSSFMILLITYFFVLDVQIKNTINVKIKNVFIK